MQSLDLLARPILNRSRFEALTLGDKSLQASLIAAFRGEAANLRSSIAQAARESAESFEDVVHRIRNVSYFIGGDRLAWLVAEIGKRHSLETKENRTQAALLIASEISALEDVVEVVEGTAQPPEPGLCRSSEDEGPV